jgi:hypothetical protein
MYIFLDYLHIFFHCLGSFLFLNIYMYSKKHMQLVKHLLSIQFIRFFFKHIHNTWSAVNESVTSSSRYKSEEIVVIFRIHTVSVMSVCSRTMAPMKKKGKNDSTTHIKKRRTYNSSFSLSLLRYDVALIFRFSHLNKTVRCCCIIVPLFCSLSSTRARTHIHRPRLPCFSYKEIYIFYEETHHIFRVVTHNNNQTD